MGTFSTKCRGVHQAIRLVLGILEIYMEPHCIISPPPKKKKLNSFSYIKMTPTFVFIIYVLVFEHITCGTLLDEISPNEYYQPKPDAHQGDNSPVTTMAANDRFLGVRRFRLNPSL